MAILAIVANIWSLKSFATRDGILGEVVQNIQIVRSGFIVLYPLVRTGEQSPRSMAITQLTRGYRDTWCSENTKLAAMLVGCSGEPCGHSD